VHQKPSETPSKAVPVSAFRIKRVPHTPITTADHDDRVVPAHSFKFAAALQAAQGGDAPVLIRIEPKAGHGAGKPTAKQIDEIADQWGF
jgi:prolyl oligopeptidase